MRFAEWFAVATGNAPFPYQERLAAAEDWPLLMDVPTGCGKTAAVVLGWVWRRSHAPAAIQQQTPRRLVFCLPMRSLVEQTHQVVQGWLANLARQSPEAAPITTEILMGGAVSLSWDERIDQSTILIGTQDQLLSRALNRGYAVSRYRWPIHFAQLNNDCLWVIDETQLMGAGLRTTAQLQWLRHRFQTYGITRTLWMSATLDAAHLRTVDYCEAYGDLGQPWQLDDRDRAIPVLQQRLSARKTLHRAAATIPAKSGDKDLKTYAQTVAAEVIAAHRPDTLTLVVCNQVDRAQAVYRALQGQLRPPKARSPQPPPAAPIALGLLHSRYRAGDRQTRNARYLNRESPFRGILVATQAIEAGVDISAATLFTELCPWSSLVQRLGRCNRYGEYTEANGGATVSWIDFAGDLAQAATTPPYDAQALGTARDLIMGLSQNLGEAGIAALADWMQRLSAEARPQQPVSGMVLRSHDLLQLFDTASDLAGHDTDISVFIRETTDREVALAWRDLKGVKPSADAAAQGFCPPPAAAELCRVSLAKAREFLKKDTTTFWGFDPVDRVWRSLREGDLYPGMVVVVPTDAGGYTSELGFTGQPQDRPVAALPSESPGPSQRLGPHPGVSGDRDDPLSYGSDRAISLTQHAQDAHRQAVQLCEALAIADVPTVQICRAARYHDAGKAHPEFQKQLHWQPDAGEIVPPPEPLLAKTARDPNRKLPRSAKKRGFRWLRHEWASALLALQTGEAFLVAYLVACHHGKVRLVVQPYPNEAGPTDGRAYARGVWEGDVLPPLDLGDGVRLAATRLSLACVALGDSPVGDRAPGSGTVEPDDGQGDGHDDPRNVDALSGGEPSWVARSLDLLEDYGPFRLAYLETLVRIADWRASAQYLPELLPEAPPAAAGSPARSTPSRPASTTQLSCLGDEPEQLALPLPGAHPDQRDPEQAARIAQLQAE
jgi:CRISPR-associated endonuclease/helicase Cas3